MAGETTERDTFCNLCLARCGAVAELIDGRFTALKPNPNHPTGKALCSKGRASPELVYNPDRILYPLKRRNPKGAADPDWQRISWDQALDEIAENIQRIVRETGPQALAFSSSSPSTTAMSDNGVWIERLMNAIGTPNIATNVELCGWGRGFATAYTYGVSSVAIGGAMPDIDNAGCLILWGYNPSMNRLTHGTAISEAVKRGMKLIVIDPRRIGLANKADAWLQVRPGTDGALALGLAHLMLKKGQFDGDFVRDWSNGSFLVRMDEGRLLTGSDLGLSDSDGTYISWANDKNAPVIYLCETTEYDGVQDDLALFGTFDVATSNGTVRCQTVLSAFADLCAAYDPQTVERICGVKPDDLERAVDLIWNARPTAYYAYSGHEQHTNTTQTARAMSLLYALTGCFDKKGGNVLFSTIPQANLKGQDFAAAQNMADPLGLEKRPLGPAKFGHITSRDLYTAILDKKPYAVRGLMGFGANILMAHAGPDRGREALQALDFYAHADLFMTPTAEMADIVLPVASSFEREGLQFGFEISQNAQSFVQLRQPVIAAQGESRSDMRIIFDLAVRLGFADEFWNGDIDIAFSEALVPSGLTLNDLRMAPTGIDVALDVTYEKYRKPKDKSAPGFATPSGKVEFWSERFRSAGYEPLPNYEPPLMGHENRPELLEAFPLLLSSAKPATFCNTQHRMVPALRKKHPNPVVELHPDLAAVRSIADGDWIEIRTPAGTARAVAKFNDILPPDLVIGEHGWWPECAELGLDGIAPFGKHGMNFNRLIGITDLDPISGTAPHKSYLCDITSIA